MKNNEIFQIAAVIALAAVLLYRRYGKKKKANEGRDNITTGKSLLSSKHEDDDYEPYSNKNLKEQ